MLHEIMLWMIGLLIVDPLQAEISERLSKVRAPQALIAEVRICAEASLPRLAERASSEPVWVITTLLNVWTGSVAAEDALGDASPQCEAAIRSARAFLESRGAGST